jgi:hypothetical protein
MPTAMAMDSTGYLMIGWVRCCGQASQFSLVLFGNLERSCLGPEEKLHYCIETSNLAILPGKKGQIHNKYKEQLLLSAKGLSAQQHAVSSI